MCRVIGASALFRRCENQCAHGPSAAYFAGDPIETSGPENHPRSGLIVDKTLHAAEHYFMNGLGSIGGRYAIC